jgi:DNA polymerase III delta prime subunit
MSLTPIHLIGKTGLIGQVLQTKIPRLLSHATDPIERRWLFLGPPGIGKSELAKLLARDIAGHEFNIERRIGSTVSVEVVRDWQRSAPYRPLIGRFFTKVINEIETIPTAALVELRDYLDELPPSVVFIATTNRLVKELQEQLQSRFQFWKFDPVQTTVIAEFLAKRFPELPAPTLQAIATKAAGNVRAALEDAAGEMDVLRFRQLAA